MVHDRIVAGILSQDIREKLLTEGDAHTLDKAIDLAVTYETTQQYLKSMATSATPTSVDAIKQKTQQASGQQRRQEDKRIQYRHHEVIDCQNCGETTQTKRMPSIWSGMQKLPQAQPLGKDVPRQAKSGVQHRQ